jgi:hypothetical protein
MPVPTRTSRFALCTAIDDNNGRQILTDREPFTYRPLPDNWRHEVNDGDTLQSLAAQRYPNQPFPASLWWVIADFQPEEIDGAKGPGLPHPPIQDPTLALIPGRIIYGPSERTFEEEIIAEKRRVEFL